MIYHYYQERLTHVSKQTVVYRQYTQCLFVSRPSRPSSFPVRQQRQPRIRRSFRINLCVVCSIQLVSLCHGKMLYKLTDLVVECPLLDCCLNSGLARWSRNAHNTPNTRGTYKIKSPNDICHQLEETALDRNRIDRINLFCDLGPDLQSQRAIIMIYQNQKFVY